MAIQPLPIYSEFFPIAGNPPADWGPFKTPPDSLDVVAPAQIDFAVPGPQETCWKMAKKIVLLVLKIVIFPWGLYEGVKYLLGRIFMAIVYPAQFLYSVNELDAIRRRVAPIFYQNVVIRSVVLEKNGVRYSGLIFGRPENISNGKWAIQAVGNGTPIEHMMDDFEFLDFFMTSGYNFLLVNGPGVGRSEGPAAPDRIGDAQEVGISFLETALKAQKIVLAGHSLGGAAIGRAVLQHEFREDTDYLVIRTFTFDTLSHIAGRIAGCVGRGLVHWLGYEMDNVAASRKLQQLRIHEVVFSGGLDDVMEGVHLVDALMQEPDQGYRRLQNFPEAGHNDGPWGEMQKAITDWEQSLEQKPLQVI